MSHFGEMMLRPYQMKIVAQADEYLSKGTPGLFVLPTGTGKSYCQIELMNRRTRSWLIAPRTEIIDGTIAKGGDESRIFTPMKLLNALDAGKIPALPSEVQWDEGHHAIADTYQRIRAYLGSVPQILWTATPYRGTPKGTAALWAEWGRPIIGLTYPEAVREGVLAMPSCRVVPLVDDDIITVTNGDFAVRAASNKVISHAAALAELYAGLPKMPTMFALPSVEACLTVGSELDRLGLKYHVVTGETSADERKTAFDSCVKGESVLLQIFVVSEGVDLQIRRLIDARPTMSPVVMVQQVGRIMRPGEVPPEYICCCRNLERFCYLFDGLIPEPVLKEAQTVFGSTSKRSPVRTLGFEAFGRFKKVDLPLASGACGEMYSLQTVEGHHCIQWAVLLHPLRAEPIVAKRQIRKKADGTYDYEARPKWVKVDKLPEELTGYSSTNAGVLTEPMRAWWKRSAKWVGLDNKAEVNRKTFQALPVLMDIKERL